MKDGREGSDELWQVNEEEAAKFHAERLAKYDIQRAKLNMRKRKYVGNDANDAIQQF